MDAPVLKEKRDPYCLTDVAAAQLLAGAPWKRLVVLGSTATGGPAASGGYAAVPWYDRCAAALRGTVPALAYRNALGRREVSVAQLRSGRLAKALAFRGDLAVVAYGHHDLLHPVFDADALEVEFQRILTSLRDAGADVLLLSPYGIPDRSVGARETVGSRQRCLRERLDTLAPRQGAAHVALSRLHPQVPVDGVWDVRRGRASGRGHAVAAAAVVRELSTLLHGGEP